jgi:YVTN family beta-propeller protein
MRSISYQLLFISLFPFVSCKGQQPFGENYLQPGKIISLPNVKGRIDHLDVNLNDQVLYVAALGNNSVEVVDMKNGKVLHSITGLSEPQGICYIPQHHEIFIANGGNGDCYFYDVGLSKIASIHLNGDADNVHYDSAERKIYVGYGSGGIALISADTHKQTGNIQLPSHPEGFQIDKKTNLLYVNLPASGAIGVADLKKLKLIYNWGKNYRIGNFPMAMDDEGHKLFIGYRHPGKLVVMDIKTGNRISVSELTNDSDDLFYEGITKRVYVSCGGGYTRLGFINIFQLESTSVNYKQIANIPTRNGARTSLLIPQLKLFVVAEPSVFSHDAELMIYKY